jgi:hypothetical protein
MARKLKTYQTSLGFFDLAIAAPSMKAALEAWGADSNLFHQGAARESNDRHIIAATLAKPGVVLRRPVGSNGPFGEHTELPTDLGDGDGKPKKAGRKPQIQKPKKVSSRPVDKTAERKALSPMSKRRSNASENVRGRRRRRLRSVNGGNGKSTRLRGRSTPPNASTPRPPRRSKPTWRPSKGGLKPKIRAGQRKRSDCRQHCGARGIRTLAAPKSQACKVNQAGTPDRHRRSNPARSSGWRPRLRELLHEVDRAARRRRHDPLRAGRRDPWPTRGPRILLLRLPRRGRRAPSPRSFDNVL